MKTPSPKRKKEKLLDEQVIRKFKESTVKRPEGYPPDVDTKNCKKRMPSSKSNWSKIFWKGFPKSHPKANTKESIFLSYRIITTPEKKTTPKRMVFDASAHAVGKPSLNDMLHQGPLMLPNLLGILMRFRTGRIATTADIEKAFLQVRLHEEDRDVTRFLWVKDLNKPPDDHNIVTLRFTRVTLGLNSSPFLLAATIDLHLDTTSNDQDVANQIRKNLYVDNLLLPAESRQEAFK
ncbi:hypothetical protein ANCDUO_14386 [Ancylostoma duodenale]|uniref:Reverse transcriptase domain-containing protein n=1 Tax=Ancylostoma duodenale TaxID=51022 RepID=A0A0C2G3H9_9BILA|nr:hypothetical protein ANCDUO_14386 [Ancylostoma duodenale]